jgi:paraquat-inducible protein B
VVKPRFSATEFSGAETLITGAYIELDPGPAGGEAKTDFIGLETPPATNSGVPGLRLTLSADEAGLLTIGAPVYHRGFEVGRVESS